MKGNIERRLADIEKQFLRDPLIVLARLPSGEEKEVKMRELLEIEDAQFLKVVAGSDVKDLDSFLQAIKRQAEKEGGGGNDPE